MGRGRKFLLWLVFGCFVLSALLAPWKRTQASPYRLYVEFSPIWLPPVGYSNAHDVTLMVAPLAFEWVGLALVAGVIMATRWQQKPEILEKANKTGGV